MVAVSLFNAESLCGYCLTHDVKTGQFGVVVHFDRGGFMAGRHFINAIASHESLSHLVFTPTTFHAGDFQYYVRHLFYLMLD